MGVETSEVTIKINVTDENSAAAVGSVTQNLNKLGEAGAEAGQKAGRGVREIGGHALSSLDNVRLLRDDFGIHIPRAMEKAIASSKVLSGAIKGIGAGLIAFGAIEIGAHIFEAAIAGANTLWKEHLSLTQAAKDYNAEVAKAAHDDFANTRSIETTRQRIDEATEAVARFHAKSLEVAHITHAPITWGSVGRAAIPFGLGQAWALYHQGTTAHDLQGQSVDAQRQADELRNKRLPEQQHQTNLDAIELQHAADGRLRGEQKITAEKAKQHEIDMENMRFDANREGLYKDYLRDSNMTAAPGSKEKQAREKQDADLANIVAPNAGESTYGTKARIADAKADADLFNLRREQGHELQRMREEALEAGLRSAALYKSQESAAIDELKFKDLDSVAARNAVHAKFHAEELKRLQEQNNQVQKMREETQLGGLTGVARIQQEGRNRTADIYRNEAGLNPGQMLAEVKAVNDQTAQQIGELNKSFKERVDEIVGQSANRELQGFARIRAEAQNQIRQLTDEFNKSGGNPADLARGVAGINAGAQGQAGDLARKNEQETEQIEAQARSKWYDAEKQKTAAIQTEYDERLRKYQDELQAQEISQDDYNRRAAAAAQEANAEMVQAATEARTKMAEQFDQFFRGIDHPMKMLEQLGDKVAGQAAAGLVQRLQMHAGGGTGMQGSSGIPLLDTVMGGFALGGGKTPGAGSTAAGAHGGHSVAQAMFAVSQATINVGGASFGGGGGSTGILAAGSSGASGGSSGGGGAWGSGTYGSGDFVGGYSGGGNTLGFPGGGGSGSAPGPSFNFAGIAAPGAVHSGSIVGSLSSGLDIFKQVKGEAGTGSLRGGIKGMFNGVGTGTRSGDTTGGGSLMSGIKGMLGIKAKANDSLDTTTPDLSGKFDKNGNFISSGTNNGGMLTGAGATMGNTLGAVGGALGMYSAVEGTGGFGGALKGGMSGMQLGGALAGPMGAAIGMGVGAAVGAIGIGGREQARVYDLKTVRPKLTSDQDSYAQGGMDYMSAYSDVQQMIGTSWAATKKMGPAAESYWGDTIKPELLRTMGKFTAEERAGRSMYTASGASFATGTPNVPETGYARVHANERIFSSVDNREITRAVVEGNQSKMPVQQGMSGDVNLHVHTIDARGVADFLDRYKHDIRDSINQSYGENSGGGLN
ncbi:MAG: hypothetical protein ABSE46_18505 [Terracidiphilus sp.]|jgi:hypothetical protein